VTTSALRLERWFARCVLAMAVLLFGLATATHARSEASPVSELDEARALFREGLSLEVAGSWAQALAKFERVARVRFTPQVRFHIARCKEHLGRMTEALGDYRISEYEAERDGLSELGEIAAARKDLEARVPKLVIVRGAGAERAVVELDGVEIGEASIGAELAVDLGPHTVTGRSAGHQPFERTLLAEERGRYEVLVEAGQILPPAPVPTAVSLEPQPSESASATPAWPVRDASTRASTSPWPWVFAGVGVVSAGAGVALLVRRADAIEEQERHCVGGVCNAAFRSQVEDAESREETSGTLALVAFSLSAAALGTALTLWFTEDGRAADGLSSLTVARRNDGVDISLGARF
jgi:hypothetical protein